MWDSIYICSRYYNSYLFGHMVIFGPSVFYLFDRSVGFRPSGFGLMNHFVSKEYCNFFSVAKFGDLQQIWLLLFIFNATKVGFGGNNWEVERKMKAVENRVLQVDVLKIKSRVVLETKEKIESRKTELRKNRQIFPGRFMIWITNMSGIQMILI